MTDRPDVAARLRAAADGHRPDRARMWARASARLPAGSRLEAGRARPRPRRAWQFPWPTLTYGRAHGRPPP
ncbi:hypothetical protein ACLIYP_29830, partial [Streptomyces nanhaiensis]